MQKDHTQHHSHLPAHHATMPRELRSPVAYVCSPFAPTCSRSEDLTYGGMGWQSLIPGVVVPLSPHANVDNHQFQMFARSSLQIDLQARIGTFKTSFSCSPCLFLITHFFKVHEHGKNSDEFTYLFCMHTPRVRT